VTKVIQHLVASKANVTLIVPYWPSSPFWRFLFINGQCCQPYVVDLFVFPSSLGIFALGDYKDSLIGSNKFKILVFINVVYCKIMQMLEGLSCVEIRLPIGV
jgi:hypothetical protein